ncbi:MAG TPA: zinc-ribbon domain-containing protein [Longimicrobiaceae bacterium]
MSVACRQCGNPVDENAAVCPHCGAQWPGRRAAEATYAMAGPGRVVITGVEIPFGSMVGLILKVMIASIPAYIIMFIFFAVLGALFSSVLVGLIGGMAGLGGMH